MAFDFRLPEAYRSVDFRVFEGLLKLTASTIKGNIDSVTKLVDIEHCPTDFVEFLGDRIGYEYNYNTSTQANKELLKHWWEMLQNKGNIRGLKLAVAFAFICLRFIASEEDFTWEDLLEITSYISMVTISITYSTGVIEILYPEVLGTTTDIEDLIEHFLPYVMPAGMTYLLTPAEVIPTEETIVVSESLTVGDALYTDDDFASYDEDVEFGFSEVSTDENLD